MKKTHISGEASSKFGRKAYGENGEFTQGIDATKLADIVNDKMQDLVFDVPQEAYDELSEANKAALTHLVKAADILDKVFLQQDHPDNIRAKEALEKAAKAGDEYAQHALKLFTLHNGIEGTDLYAQKSEPVRLFKDKQLGPGKGFYPQDITKEELVDYIADHPEQASAIFGHNTIVKRDGDRLVAEPFSVAFRTEMEAAAKELLAAANATDHDGLAKYLRLQAQALVNDSDPEAVYNADKAWVNLEDSPLEFTIGRENYEDRLSSAAAADPKVKAILDANGIKAKSKDSIGVRVGIVNQESYAEIADYRKHLEAFAKEMPLADKYKQQTEGSEDSKMTFADVDLVAFTGDYAAVRGGITVAQNLPNDDKLAVQQNEGSRLVFHRQVRKGGDPKKRQEFLDALVDQSQHKWYEENADFLFTVGHELAHSLGPRMTADGRDKKGALGDFGGMLEENKADVASIVMTDYFVQVGKFTEEEANKIYLTWASRELPQKQPSDDEAHRSRSVMQLNYFREKGAIKFEKGGKLSIVPEKMAEAARAMLTEVIQLQLDGDPAKAEKFVRKYTAWNDALQYACDEQMKMKPKRYRYITQPKRDELLELANKPVAGTKIKPAPKP